MRTLYYPSLSEADMSFIERFRHEHDAANRQVVAPHVTMVFGCSAVGESEYRQHVGAVAKANAAIRVVCRYAMLGSDDQGQTAHVFLVPDEGYSGLSLLHDRLYANVLASHMRLDIPFIPHMTIGTLGDRRFAKRLCDGLNQRGIAIHGSIDALTVGALENDRMQSLASFPLRTTDPALPLVSP